MVLAVFTLVLSLAGLFDMLYATGMHYGWLTAASPAPQVCNLSTGVCETTFSSPQSMIFGIPISVFGIAYYSLICIAAIVRLNTGTWPVPSLVVLGIGLAAVVSIFLSGMLIFTLREFCPVCVIGHAINFSLAAAFLYSIMHARSPQRPRTLSLASR